MSAEIFFWEIRRFDSGDNSTHSHQHQPPIRTFHLFPKSIFLVSQEFISMLFSVQVATLVKGPFLSPASLPGYFLIHFPISTTPFFTILITDTHMEAFPCLKCVSQCHKNFQHFSKFLQLELAKGHMIMHPKFYCDMSETCIKENCN